MAIYQSQYTGKQIDDAIANQKKMLEIIIRNSKQIENLKQGTADQFETDLSVAYVKDVPENALPYAEIKKIGGMTYKDGNTLKSAKVTEVESVGANLLPFPYASGGSGTVVESGGGKIEVLSGGGLSLSGTPTGYIGFRLYQGKLLYKGKQTLILSGDYTNYSATVFLYTDETANTEIARIAVLSSGMTFDTNDYPSATYMIVETARITSGSAMTGVFYPMLNKGATPLPDTPYIKHTLRIPEAVRPVNGINENVYDYIEWAEDGSVKETVECGEVDLGTLDWGIYAGYIYATLTKTPKQHAVGICTPYDVVTFNYSLISNGQMVIYDNGFSADAKIILKDDSYTDAATFKTAMSGVMLVYELATPKITDISDLITDDNFIEVQGGGTLTFANEYGLAVPSEITYMLKENVI